jgi:acetyl esterase
MAATQRTDQLHPDVAALLADMRAAGMPAVSAGSAEDARSLLQAMRRGRSAGPDMHHMENTQLCDTGVAARIYEPVADPVATVLYLHGGGWVIGEIETSDFAVRHLARSTGCRIVSVGYRLAPEHPFPAAVQDTEMALHWLARWVSRLPGNRQQIVVAGDSAGGNLATVAALRARDAGGPAIAGQMLFYPVVDCDFDTSSYLEAEETVPLSSKDMRWFWTHYAPLHEERMHPHASPLRAASLAGMPPTFLATAQFDPLRDEGELYAARLRSAGVVVQLKRYPGTVHGFFSLPDRLEPARELLADCGVFLRGLGLGRLESISEDQERHS